MTPREVGRTKDAGWQIGVSRVVDHPIEEVWSFITSVAGTDLWLGHGVRLNEDKGYETADGTVGEVRSIRPLDRLRLTWQPEDSDHDTIVQIVVRANGPDRTTITFHQERMVNASERERQRVHWWAVMADVVASLDGSPVS